jgi:uncharacterized protein
MNFVYRIQGVEFEWDTNKNESNFVKHGVRFEEVAEVFFDPFYQEVDASDNSDNNEQRDFILGYSLSQRLLLVIYVERKARKRIISARPTTKTERRLYEQ